MVVDGQGVDPPTDEWMQRAQMAAETDGIFENAPTKRQKVCISCCTPTALHIPALKALGRGGARGRRGGGLLSLSLSLIFQSHRTIYYLSPGRVGICRQGLTVRLRRRCRRTCVGVLWGVCVWVRWLSLTYLGIHKRHRGTTGTAVTRSTEAAERPTVGQGVPRPRKEEETTTSTPGSKAAVRRSKAMPPSTSGEPQNGLRGRLRASMRLEPRCQAG